MPTDAIAAYHDQLTDALAAESQEMLDELQRRRGLAFGDRPVCTVLRPRFLTPHQYRFLQDRVRVLMRAFGRIHHAGLADAGFRRQFCLTEDEERLLEHDPGFGCPMPTSRLDAFFVSEQELRFTEFNAETPAGAGYADALAQVFHGLPAMRPFLHRYRLIPLPACPGIYHALLSAYREWPGHRGRPPRLAIIDWREVPTYSEFVLFQQYFLSLGLDCLIADPRQLDYRDGKLWAGSYEITLVYKRILIGELLERGGLDHPLVQAVRDGAVCMVNPFRCKMLYKKASLAVLSDERNAALFPAEEQQTIAAHIPWTRVVEERHTTHACRPVDLVPFVLHNRERLVLKPNDDYGGKGIVLGWLTDAGRWEQAVQTALAHPYVVQERVALPQEPFPCLHYGKLAITDRMLDTAPFVCGGEFMDSCLTRIATDPLLNVTAGGGSTVPTFVVEPR